MFNQGQYPMMSYPQMQQPDYEMSYARGGSVPMGLSGIADLIRSFGAGKDGILAHINPEEAEELSGENGYDINPFTGLPQFGLWDRMKSALPGPGGIANMMGSVGNAAMGALPGLYEQARPYMSQGLQKADQSIMGALPGIGQKIGGMFGQQGAALGQSFGNQIGQQFGNAGGLSNYVMGQADQRMGMGAPNPQQPYNFGNMARQVGQGVWGDVGKGMASQALNGADQRIMQGLQGMSQNNTQSALGRARGALGGAAANMYGDSSGMAGYAMPRLNQAIGTQAPQMPQRNQYSFNMR